MDRFTRSLAMTLLAVFFVSTLRGQARKYDEMSLEELLNQKVSVSSIKPQTVRESPGIITVITSEEIENSGARDLIDVLQMVPGLAFGTDVENVVGIGVRGNWAAEGKVLLLLDDQEFNEPLYASLQFGNHFPLDAISRIEIIRGPGSAVYGGFAELAVIRIVTKGAQELNGGHIQGTYGAMADTFGRRTVSFSAGRQIRDWNLAFHAFGGQGNRSDQVYTDVYGNQAQMAEQSRLDPLNLNGSVSYKGMEVRFLADRFSTTNIDSYDEVTARPVDVDFNSYFLEAKYSRKVGKALSLLPRFRFKRQTPWHSVDTDEAGTILYYDHQIDRYTGGLTALYAPSDKFTLTGGTEIYRDQARITGDATAPWYFRGDRSSIDYSNSAFFSEASLNTFAGNFTLGARYSNHSQFGGSFVPRIAYTKVHGRFHVKALVARAFREPSVENLDVNPLIKPERTTAVEFEAGCQISPQSFLSANVFDLTIKQPIVYFADPDENVESYLNFPRTGSRGIEVEYRYKQERGYASLSYSYYNTAGKNEVDYYRIPGEDSHMLGLPAHKLAAVGSLHLGHDLHLTPSLVYIGQRWGYRNTGTGQDGEGSYDAGRVDSEILANVYFRVADIKGSGLELGAGVFDLFNRKIEYVQPYNLLHAPLPGPSREFIVRLGYHWGFAQ